MKPIEELLEDAVRDAIVDVFMFSVDIGIHERWDEESDKSPVDVAISEIRRNIRTLNRMEMKNYA